MAETYDSARRASLDRLGPRRGSRLPPQLLAARGHVLDAAPRAMAMELSGPRPEPPAPEGVEPGPCDAPTAAALNDRAYGYEPERLPAPALAGETSIRWLGAYAGAEPVGCVGTIEVGDDCCVTGVATPPEQRGRGIASWLLLRALADGPRAAAPLTASLQATKAGGADLRTARLSPTSASSRCGSCARSRPGSQPRGPAPSGSGTSTAGRPLALIVAALVVVGGAAGSPTSCSSAPPTSTTPNATFVPQKPPKPRRRRRSTGRCSGSTRPAPATCRRRGSSRRSASSGATPSGRCSSSRRSIVGGKLYFVNNNGSAYALDADTGKVLWERSIGRLNASSPAYSKHRLYIVNLVPGHVVKLDAKPAR